MKFKVPNGRAMKVVSRRKFVAYWSDQYRYSKEDLYTRNRRKPFTLARLRTLFLWKNGRKLSSRKEATVRHLHADPLQRHARAPEVRRYLLKRGGPIWRIFWLHLQRPDRFPVFDRRVYAAMAQITGRGPSTIPSGAHDKIDAYLDRYVAFFNTFNGFPHRRVDRALFWYGRHLEKL